MKYFYNNQQERNQKVEHKHLALIALVALAYVLYAVTRHVTGKDLWGWLKEPVTSLSTMPKATAASTTVQSPVTTSGQVVGSIQPTGFGRVY